MVLLVLVGLLSWFVLPLPLAMAVGRAFRRAHGVRPRHDGYDLAA